MPDHDTVRSYQRTPCLITCLMIGIMFLMSPCVLAQTNEGVNQSASFDNWANARLANFDEKLAGWWYEFKIELIFSICLALLAAITAALQPIKSKLANITGILFGILLFVATTTDKGIFNITPKQFFESVRAFEVDKRHAANQLASFPVMPSEEGKAVARVKIEQLITGLDEHAIAIDKMIVFWSSMPGTVHAQTRQAASQSFPGYRLTATGNGRASSVENAKQAALTAAATTIGRSLQQTLPGASLEQLTAYVKTKATIADWNVTAEGKEYVYAIRLQLSPSYANALALQAFQPAGFKTSGAADRLAPVALGTVTAGLVVLDDREGVLIRRSSRFEKLITIPPSLDPIDLATGSRTGREEILLALYNPSTRLSSLWAISDTGITKQWVSLERTRFAGIAGGKNGLIYVSDAAAKQVLVYEWPGPVPRLVRTYTVTSAEHLGPVLLDELNQNLFVGDRREGLIFRIKLTTGQVTRFGAGVGDVSALQLDLKTGRIYAADASGRRIRVLALNNGARMATITAPGFRQPTGLALTGQEVYVGDQSAGKVFVLNNAGNVVRSLTGTE